MNGKSKSNGARAAEEPRFDLRPAWRLDDAAIQADAVAFWNRLGILPPDVKPEQRARELAAAAYRDGTLVGVATATIARLEALRGRFAFMRAAVDPAHRRSAAAIALTICARDAIERWSVEHPEEKLLGLAAIIESPDLAIRQSEPVWPLTRMNLVGFTPQGRQVRVAWFAHARID